MTRGAEHRAVIELLPWFVNGTLSDADRARVEAHVRDCMSCYAALQQERRVHTLVAGQSAGKIFSAEHGFERLAERLDGSPGRVQRMRRNAQLLAVAASIAALGVTALLWTQSVRESSPAGAAFETLADTHSADGSRLDVVFTDTLTQAELRELLQTYNAMIVGGPTDIGRYTIEVEAAEIDSVIAALRGDPRVRFVGRSFIEGDQR